MQIKHDEKNQTRQTDSKPSTVSQRYPCPLHLFALLSPDSIVNKATWPKCRKRNWRVRVIKFMWKKKVRIEILKRTEKSGDKFTR